MKKKTNEELLKTIKLLEEKGRKERVNLWKTLAKKLSIPTRKKIIVNVEKIARFKDFVIVVPGKVIGNKKQENSLKVSAFKFSKNAKKNIEEAGGKAMTLNELIASDIKAKEIKIVV